MKKVKLIWVFSGPDAEEMAKAKEVLLVQLGEEEDLDFYYGTEYISHISWLAYFIVSEEAQSKYLSDSNPTIVEEFDD